jgi:putative transcriptional regulator
MAKARYKSDASEAIHSAASGLHQAKVIDKKTMRDYDELCIEEVPEYNAADIARIRKDVNVSQNVFALYLNTTVSTVRQWSRATRSRAG